MLAGLLIPTVTFAITGNEKVLDASMFKDGSRLEISLSLDLNNVKLNRNQAVLLQPMIVNGEDTLVLDGVGIYSRTRKLQLERRGGFPISGSNEITFQGNKYKEPVTLTSVVSYRDWMNGSSLILRRSDYGCAGCNEENIVYRDLAQYEEYVPVIPEFKFAVAVTETIKTRELCGRAYVDFPVNLTSIHPEYRHNSVELAKILATIDSVKNDKDITVTSLNIKGFASPEGPYDNNIRLAKGRTEALKNYVQQLYKFPDGFIKTAYEPEDWEGLKEWIENSNIDNKEALLAIIDSDLQPDTKNTKIQTAYPIQYRFLLENVYPGLRHSDYRIEYEIKHFTDVAEIAEVIKTAPQKLSLNEMYALANTLEPGSDDYNEIFETAVRMYPDDETANLNAANAAMIRGDLITAERYLKKAGYSELAQYAREVYKVLLEIQQLQKK